MKNANTCNHKKTKEKLVSWAIDSRYGYEQGFKKVECCSGCGVIKTQTPAKKESCGG